MTSAVSWQSQQHETDRQTDAVSDMKMTAVYCSLHRSYLRRDSVLSCYSPSMLCADSITKKFSVPGVGSWKQWSPAVSTLLRAAHETQSSQREHYDLRKLRNSFSNVLKGYRHIIICASCFDTEIRQFCVLFING